MIGTFYQPKMVWADLAILQTLPKREIICGLGEIIKYGLIKDPELFQLVEENLEVIVALDLKVVQEIVMRCCQIKAEIVAQDEKETGPRMVLNFGHTIAHALEAEMGYKRISHGEAVLLGMLVESKIALNLKMLNKEDFLRIEKLVSRLELTAKLNNIEVSRLLEFIKNDKKSSSGQTKVILPLKIGEVEIVDEVEEDLIRSSLTSVL